ncbi:MAG TPA: hypothetical protein VJR58_03455 [Vineibacter sp.]|nr:hypothetical protein [Vineibacter sp.]
MAKENQGQFARALLTSLRLRPFCDHSSTRDLTPEQVAALHAFLHEVLASFYRLSMVLPEEQTMKILDHRFTQAFDAKPAKAAR